MKRRTRDSRELVTSVAASDVFVSAMVNREEYSGGKKPTER